MVLHTVAGQRLGEDTDDLQSWLRALEGCPTVTHTHLLTCRNEVHSDPATWFYLEADPSQGVVRRRCLACGLVAATLDSEDRWSHPHMWACRSCGQSIAEAAAGLHAPGDDSGSPGPVSWVAIAVRCVGCGVLAGVTDFVVPNATWEEVVPNL